MMFELQTPDLWAGVDVGTQSLRVCLVDSHGTVAGSGSGRLTSHRGTTDGTRRHEQDPRQWWRVLGAAFRQAWQSLPDNRIAGRVRGVAICSTSGTFLLADADNRPRTMALMYDDARAGAEADEVCQVGQARWLALGYPMQPSWALPKLLWLLRHEAHEAHDVRTLRLQHCADHLAARLTGTPVATDWSHALKTGFDLEASAWPSSILDKLGVPEKLLPPVVRPGTVIGTISAEGSAHTGLPLGVPVHAGLTDGCAAQVAAGALTPGAWNSVLGTTLVLKGVTPTRLADPGGAVYSHRHPDGGWLPGGASNVGAGALEARFPGTDRAALDALAAGFEPSGGLTYPLVSRGERFPFVDPSAEAFELGPFAGEGDRYAAVLQGVAFVERLCFAYLARLGADVTGPVSVTGGATRSAYWTQLRADILGRELLVPAQPEPAFGAAVIAAAGDGPLTETALRMAGPARIVTPNGAQSDRFTEPYHRFLDALSARGYIDESLTRFAKETAK